MTDLRRHLSPATTFSIVVGGIIGSGIFMKPSLMAAQLGSPLLLLSVWVVAGLITLLGALSNAEAACMFPETGGQFVFFKNMYGDLFAFLYGWSSFAVFNTAGNASIAYVCSQYIGDFVQLPRFSAETESLWTLHIPLVGSIHPLEQIGLKSLTFLIVLLLSLVNCRSTSLGGALQRVLTLLKAAAMLLLIAGLFTSGKASFAQVTEASANTPSGMDLLTACMAAVAGAFWAYDGWNNITFVAGEVRDPQKNIPKSLFAGLAFCILVYFLINLAYVCILPVKQIADSPVIAADVAFAVWGPAGATLIGLMVILSTFGTTHANIFSTARVTFAMSEENRLFLNAGKVNRNFGTPANAILLNAAWSSVLIFSGSFDMLTDMLIFVSWFFYGMSALGIFILRKKMKTAHRPYRVWGYPFTPLVFLCFTLSFLLITLYDDISNYLSGKQPIANSLFGLLIALVGIPIYYLGRKKRLKGTRRQDNEK
jgi:basic amino acid/polyamine antiporter, APA family